MSVAVAIPTLQGEMVRLRAVTVADAPRLAEILDHPAVAKWWGHHDVERVEREVIAAGDGTIVFAVEVDDKVVGLIQYFEENEPDYRHAGIDISVHPDWHHRGIGADALRTLARHLISEGGHHRLTIDPAAHNARAIRSYASVGFRPVGIMRRYERGADGTWHDGLLMDLLADELT